MSDNLKLILNKAGFHTSIQDEGRFGVQDLGIPIGGALDKEAMQTANMLVGNSPNTPVLEITMIGPKISFQGKGQIAITGADMTPELNGQHTDSYKTVNINSGDELVFHNAKTGCRAYISIGGEWETTKWLESYSSSSILDNHSQLKDGDSLSVKSNLPIDVKEYPLSKRPIYSYCYIIRVVTGPEFELFDLPQIEDFFNKIFTVGNESNRMGYRLNGELVNYSPKREEISSGIVTGTVQITSAGNPIILLADAQTTGGYPRIANVVTEDLSIVAQMKPGDELKFMLISQEDL